MNKPYQQGINEAVKALAEFSKVVKANVKPEDVTRFERAISGNRIKYKKVK